MKIFNKGAWIKVYVFCLYNVFFLITKFFLGGHYLFLGFCKSDYLIHVIENLYLAWIKTDTPGMLFLVYINRFIIHVYYMQARRQEFPEGGSLICIMSCEPGFAGCYYGRGSGVFTAASCNLAISRHFIQTFV